MTPGVSSIEREESFNERGEPEWVFSRALGVDIPLTSLTVIG